MNSNGVTLFSFQGTSEILIYFFPTPLFKVVGDWVLPRRHSSEAGLAAEPSVRQTHSRQLTARTSCSRKCLSFVRRVAFSLCENAGGDEENRTPDPLLARQVLSQLSYTPKFRLILRSFEACINLELVRHSVPVSCCLIVFAHRH